MEAVAAAPGGAYALWACRKDPMAASSIDLPLGTQLPSFSLPDTVTNKAVSSQELSGRPSVIAFLCNHCPYVKHIQPEFVRFAAWAAERGVAVIAISSNDVTSHPQDGPQAMAEEARENGYRFPYLFDESQAVAKAFKAVCTPDLYLFDGSGKLYYHGRFDGSSPGNGAPLTGADLRGAVEALLEGQPPKSEQLASVGCSIKWRAGNAPDYA
jgi:peroxiredoxin